MIAAILTSRWCTTVLFTAGAACTVLAGLVTGEVESSAAAAGKCGTERSTEAISATPNPELVLIVAPNLFARVPRHMLRAISGVKETVPLIDGYG